MKILQFAENFWLHTYPHLIFVIAILVAIIIAVFLQKIIVHFVKRLGRSETMRQYIKFGIKYWRKPFLLLLIVVNLSLSQIFVTTPSLLSAYYQHLLAILTIAFFTWASIGTLYIIRDVIFFRQQKSSSDKDNFATWRVYTRFNILLKIAAIALGIFGGALALITIPKIQAIGVSLLASAGAAGVIFGLAAQKSLANLLAGIQIAFTQPIRMNDVVIVEGEYGTIEEITLTYVIVRVWDLRRLVVPINYFLEKVFENWTRFSSDLIGTVFLEVDYQVPLKVLREQLDSILQSADLWDGKVKNLVITDAKTQTMQIRALVSAKDAPTAWNLRCFVREKLIEFLQENYPQSLPKLRVELNQQ